MHADPTATAVPAPLLEQSLSAQARTQGQPPTVSSHELQLLFNLPSAWVPEDEPVPVCHFQQGARGRLAVRAWPKARVHQDAQSAPQSLGPDARHQGPGRSEPLHPSIHPAPSAPLSASFSSVSVLVAAGARGRMNPIAWRRQRGATDANIASSVTYILTAGTSRPQLSSRGRVKVPTCPFSSSSIPVGSSAAELFPALGRRPPAKAKGGQERSRRGRRLAFLLCAAPRRPAPCCVSPLEERILAAPRCIACSVLCAVAKANIQGTTIKYSHIQPPLPPDTSQTQASPFLPEPPNMKTTPDWTQRDNPATRTIVALSSYRYGK
ncbi:hypothetical protein Purlil1_9288 [Purpureocillium lilacinum]|uniref:Uncharacterized protein n=1 Tax=Purpureocillium lilacinum TaxID=33203 RepID=A0ABR0BRF7_PURLI|nr:hypothetical protein Purlil1_9288 [Purpureocillium lilacinum]